MMIHKFRQSSEIN